MRYNLRLVLLMAIVPFISFCSKDTAVEEEPVESSAIAITFGHINPCEVYPGDTVIDGVITSTLPLVSYSVQHSISGGNSVTLVNNDAIDNKTEFDFAIPVNVVKNSRSVIVIAKDASGISKSETLSFTVLEDIEGEVPAEEIDGNLAFPGAEGFGAYTTGGRGGKVLVVTSLEDNGSEGTLRWAINQSGARTVVFQVSGDIILNSPLNIVNGNLTIAGHSAPGDGICVRGNYMQLKDGLDNVIIRYMRFRSAVGSGEYDAAWGRNCSNIIIDHCSFSWGNDEVASFYDNTNFTMQWCMVSESFYSSTHPKGNHGYGGIWGGMGASFHHNLIAHNTSRNPRFCGARFHWDTRDAELVDFRNNVLYNWGDNSVYGGEGAKINMVNNYYKPGPATKKTYRIVEIYGGTNSSDAPEDGQWYVDGNYVYGNSNVSSNNILGIDIKNTIGSKTDQLVSGAFEVSAIMTESAESAFESVLNSVGASCSRDAVDARVVEEARNGTATYGGVYGAGSGIIDSESTVGGFPVLQQYDEITDNDSDGMDDQWEANNGLDPDNANDHSGYDLSEDYTNLEMYLEYILSNK